MTTYGATYRCSHCHEQGIAGTDLHEQYDRYGIYAGLWHEECWRTSGYADFTFDGGFAGEHLEEEDY